MFEKKKKAEHAALVVLGSEVRLGTLSLTMSIEHGSSFKLSGSSCVRLSVRRVIRWVVGLPRRRRLAGSWSVTAFQTLDQQAEISGPAQSCQCVRWRHERDGPLGAGALHTLRCNKHSYPATLHFPFQKKKEGRKGGERG